MEVSGQLHALVALPSGEGAHGTLQTVGWLDSRAGLGGMEKRNVTRPSQELNHGHVARRYTD
jgi:hypothetical protein